MTDRSRQRRPFSMLRAFLDAQASGGLALMAAAALALVVANSPFASTYFDALHAYLEPVSVAHWIKDGLMVIFFLVVGLDVLEEWPPAVLAGLAASTCGLVDRFVARRRVEEARAGSNRACEKPR